MSTLPAEWEGIDAGPEFEPNAAESEYPAVVPVRVLFDENMPLPPTFASFMTWPIGQVGVSPATQILQRREHRFKAKFLITMPTGGTVTFNSRQEPLTKDANPQGFQLTLPTVSGVVAGNQQDGANAAIAAAVAGNVSLPNASDFLVGFAISLSTVGTAPMTITVSNVVGGPYTFTIPTGGQSLIVNFPTPLRATGGAPTVTWSATAAAVGNVSVFGITSPVSLPLPQTVTLPDFDSSQPLFAIASIAGCTIQVMDESYGQTQ